MIDPHYYKLTNQGNRFSTTVVRFLGFNHPQKHKHKVGTMSTVSIALKLNNLKNYVDRSYMNAAHMQKLKRDIQSVLEACSDYMDMLEKTNSNL